MTEGPYRAQVVSNIRFEGTPTHIVKCGSRVLFNHTRFSRDLAVEIASELNKAYFEGYETGAQPTQGYA